MNNQFLNLCVEFEQTVKEKYDLEKGQSPYIYIKDNQNFKQFRNEIELIRNIRNILSHNRRINFEDALEVSPETVEALERIIDYISNPPNAYEVCSRGVIKAHGKDRVIDIIRTMYENNYSYLPIVDSQRRVVGVFSENSVFQYLVENKEIKLDENILIRDVENYLGLDSHNNDYFDFVGKNTSLDLIKDRFHDSINYEKKLAALFVNNNGDRREPLLGIITAWDLI